MTVGTNNKKQVYVLAALGLFAAYMVYSNLLAGPDIPARSANTPADTAAGAPTVPVSATGGPRAKTVPRTTRARSEEFHPALRRARDADKQLDPNTDPTLRLDRLTKVQAVEVAGVGARNLFQFGAPPPPPVQIAAVKEPVVPVWLPYNRPQPPPPPEAPKPPPPPPPPPPIPLKYYAFWISKESGKRTACFLNSKEEIVMAGEGETVSRRYRVVRINPTSVVMEDLDVKKEQTLQLAEEVQGE